MLLREIIKALKLKRGLRAVAVTASTGIAACNIGGTTLHSFAGFGLGREPPLELAKGVRKVPKVAARWRETQVLVIDESQ